MDHASTEHPVPSQDVRERSQRRRTLRVLPPLGFTTLRWIVLALSIGAFLTLWPLWAPLVLAAWFAVIAHPLHARLSRFMGKKKQAAALATVLMVMIGLVPIALVVASLVAEAINLLEALSKSRGARDALTTLLNGGSPEPHQRLTWDLRTIAELAQRHGASAVGTVTKIAGATTSAVIGIVVFVYGFYIFLAHGQPAYEWIENNAPLERGDVARFAAAFNETGRGLIVGTGLTAALQGTVAGIGFLIIGLSHALVLGLLTAFAALIPSVGTGLVWVPLAAGLAISGEWGKMIAVLVIGSLVGIVDNFARPAFSRYGKLEMPMYLLFVAMLGGLAAFGGWGLLLGPLFVRMTIEGLRVLRERRAPRGAGAAS